MDKLLKNLLSINRKSTPTCVPVENTGMARFQGDGILKKMFLLCCLMGVCFTLSNSNLWAATIISATPELESLIEEAFDNNHELKTIAETIKSLKGKESFEGSFSDPKIGFALQNLPADNLSFNQEPMTQKQVFISQKFPWPGKLKLKSKQFALEADRVLFLLKSKKLQTAREIADVYFDLGFVSDGLILNRKLTDLMGNILNVASVKYSSGRGLQQDIFKAEVELSKLADEKIQLGKKYRVIEDRINALLNRDRYIKITPPATSELFKYGTEIEVNTEHLKTMAMENNPTMRALRIDIEKNSSMTKLAQKGNYPDFDIKLAYGQREDDKSGRDRDDFLSLSTSLNIPLWKHARQDQDIASKKAAEQAATYRYKNFAKMLPHRVDATAVEINNTIKSYKLYKNRLIPQSIKWAQSAVADYEVGKTDFGTMVNASIQPLKFELKARKYLFEILKKRAELDEITGGL